MDDHKCSRATPITGTGEINSLCSWGWARKNRRRTSSIWNLFGIRGLGDRALEPNPKLYLESNLEHDIDNLPEVCLYIRDLRTFLTAAISSLSRCQAGSGSCFVSGLPREKEQWCLRCQGQGSQNLAPYLIRCEDFDPDFWLLPSKFKEKAHGCGTWQFCISWSKRAACWCSISYWMLRCTRTDRAPLNSHKAQVHLKYQLSL